MSILKQRYFGVEMVILNFQKVYYKTRTFIFNLTFTKK